MNPSPAAITAIRAEVTALSAWGNTDAQLAASLNTAGIANPTPQATVTKPFAFGDVMGLLSSGSIANIRGLPTGTDLIDKINAQDRVGVGHWIAALLAGTPLITTDEATAVGAVIAATQLDPSWPALLSWAQVNLGRAVDTGDIAASRP